MKISARNKLKGTITRAEVGAVNVEVTLELSPGVYITSIITKGSFEALDLQEGKEAYAVIKASDVMMGVEQ